MDDLRFDPSAFLSELEARGASAPIDPFQVDPAQRERFDAINTAIGAGVRRLGRGVSQGIDSSLDLGRLALDASPRVVQGLGDVLDAFGAGATGRTPLYMQRQALGLEEQKLAQQFEQQRLTQAQHMQQLEETKRQNQWEDLFKVLGNDKLSPPQQTEMLKGMAKQNPFAAQAAQTINDKMIGDFKTWQSYLPRTPEAYQEGLQKGEITWPQVAAEIDAAKAQGMEETKALAKETATQRKMQGLLTKFKQDPNAMTDTELDLVDQHFKQQQERALKIQQLQVGIQGSRADLTKKQNAPSEVYSGIQGPQGESVTGVYDPKTGATRELRGTPIQRTQDLTATERGAMVEERAVLKQISDLDKLYHKDYVGQFDNFLASAKETAPGVFGAIDGKEELFRKTLNQIVTNARRIDAGTAQSVSELAQLAKTYPDLTQHESVFKPAVEAMRNRITSRLEARSRLAAEIASGRQKPLALSERASQLAALVSTPGFAKDADDAKRIAQEILREELKLGIVKAD